MGDEFVYGGEIYGIWTQWKSSYSLFICIFSALLLITTVIRSNTNIKKVVLGVVFSPLTLLTTILSGVTGFFLLSALSGNIVSWPGIDWPYRLLLIGSTTIGALIGTAISKQFVNQNEMVFGSWFFWLILTLTITVFLPDAANIFILPLIFASILLFLATFLKEENRPIFLLLTLVVTLPLTLGLIFSLEQSQGYKLVWAVLPFAGLYALILSPFLYSVNIKSTISFVGVVTFAALMVGSFANLYTEKRPQHVNIHFYEDLDSDESFIRLSGNYKNNSSDDPEPLIEPLSSYVNTQDTKAITPFTEYVVRYWSETSSSGWKGPSIEKQEKLNDSKSLKLHLKSARSASRMVLLLPKESNLKSFNLGSLEIQTVLSSWGLYKGYYVVYLNGVYDKEVELTLNFETSKKEVNGYLIDISTKLPNHLDELYEARSGIFSPVHTGDQAILIKKISI